MRSRNVGLSDFTWDKGDDWNFCVRLYKVTASCLGLRASFRRIEEVIRVSKG